jgi:hypothetical protein
MDRSRLILVVFALLKLLDVHSLAGETAAHVARDYHIKPVPFNRVQLQDRFWTPRLETNRTVTLPYCFQKCEETGRISNFEKAAGLKQGRHEGIYFNDSDVYKVMEGAAYSLQVHPETMMRLYLDKLITIMAGAQWDDGYLYTFYSVPERQPEKRWTDVQHKHEQYCAGHMYEAAVAHYQVTGDRSFLEVAIANADLICETFAPDKRTDPPGHQEIEIGLCKLYRATGNAKYLNQAKFFLDQRGRRGNRGPDGEAGLYGEYAQDHKPVTEQSEALGHSVRAAYLYTGMADVAALTGSMDYVKAIDRIWQDVVGTKLYVTGGIGASGGNEGFSEAYELPNVTAYCETCASIANILWNHRMFLMHGHGKYLDVLERTLYNAALSGISMRGDRFFYPNPLESFAQHGRSPWFGCACCPSNVARFIPSVPGLVYAHTDRDVYVNLFASGYATIETEGNKIRLIQQTDYPWNGKTKIMIEPENERPFSVHLRIPGWARNAPVPGDLYRFAQPAISGEPTLTVNGKPVEVNVDNGFAMVSRTWRRSDAIELNLPMPVRRVLAHPKVRANRAKAALQRGPIVFCLEGPDNPQGVLPLTISDETELHATFRPDLFGGVTVVKGLARVAKRTLDGPVITTGDPVAFTAIPYYAWAHRGPAEMTVWPARIPEAARPEPADTLTYISNTTASFVHVSLDAIKDQILPEASSDTSNRHLDFWPHKGTTEWVRFEWDREHEISSVKVYWFDDTGRGACHVPESWRVLYRNDEGRFVPVDNKTPYRTKKDAFNMVHFGRVWTDAILIEIELQERWSAGIQEVVID